MGKRLGIPFEVLEAISEHIRESIDNAVMGFWSASEDEDTLTGHFGACLKTPQRVVRVYEAQVPGEWRWSIDYTKFRGRGSAATESMIGADGIIELVVSSGSRIDRKSLLFQAKLNWHQKDAALIKQAVMLSTWREAAIFLNYTENSFEAFSIDEILSSQGVRKNAKRVIDVKDALSRHFLRCEIGNTELSYDARRRFLSWRSMSGSVVAAQFTIPNRIRFNIESPKQDSQTSYDTLLPNEQIHAHRMQVDASEMLSVPLSGESHDLARARKIINMAYHPDRHANLADLLQEILCKRMQEINMAYDELKK